MTGRFPPGWRIVPASVHGADHIEDAEENQDSLRFRRLGDGFVAAVADGAGSRPRSALGSRLAVDAACDAAGRTLARPARSLRAFHRAAHRFVGEGLSLFDRRVAAVIRASRGTARSDYATTLLAVVAQPPYFAVLSVGDGFLLARHDNGGVHLIAAPDPDPPGHGTAFLTTPGREAHVRWHVVADPALDGFALCTDGLTEALLAVEREAPGGPRRFVAPQEIEAYVGRFSDPRVAAGELARQLASPEIGATSGDDKTMIVAVRR